MYKRKTENEHCHMNYTVTRILFRNFCPVSAEILQNCNILLYRKPEKEADLSFPFSVQMLKSFQLEGVCPLIPLGAPQTPL